MATDDTIELASKAERLKTARKIYVTGDASGSVDFDGSTDVVLNLTVTNAVNAKSTERCSSILYANNAGNATTAICADYSEKCNGNSATASKLEKGRKISFRGDMESELVFDGSEDLIIQTKVKKSDSAECDSQGKNIFETYETKENAAVKFAEKDELPPFTFSIETFENNPCLLLTDKNGKTFRFVGEEIQNG